MPQTEPIPETLAPTVRPAVVDPAKIQVLILDALRQAAAGPQEHRLFRAGKVPGLFPSRTGLSAEAAQQALREGYLQRLRLEPLARAAMDTVAITPAGVAFLHQHESPQGILHELQELLGQSQQGVPIWLNQTQQELTRLREEFEQKAAAVLARLETLAGRVEDALRRAELTPVAPAGVTQLVPWANRVLAYLRQRPGGLCPLPELFLALPPMSVIEFQDGLRRLHDARQIQLRPATLAEPEFAFVHEGQLVGALEPFRRPGEQSTAA
ncbi:MAG: hypothetical protein ACRCZF_14200 [Gemmataceae bacterium]